ncbi:MAG: hypothetical protein O2985_00340 [Proteobacteria bacterium]|nr:hypothetical protein [Pseudomonadota bacterium]
MAQSQIGSGAPGEEPVMETVRGPDGKEITNEDCQPLAGATAPIQRLARLDGAMSVRNLELTYFGKPLHALTEYDFALLKILKPFCEDTPVAIDEAIFDKLEQKVAEARATRDKTIQWIAEVTAKLDAMEPSPEAIREAHNAWTEMENRRLEMLASDQSYFAKYLTDRRNALYAGKQTRPRVLVSPFDPQGCSTLTSWWAACPGPVGTN